MANAVRAFLDAHVTSGAGDRPAIVTPGASYTYSDLVATAGRAGNALRSLGVEPGQRVAFLLHDGVDFAALFFGALRIGAVAVPLNTRLEPEVYVAILRDSNATVLVLDADLVASLAPGLVGLPDLKSVVCTRRTDRLDGLDELLAAASPDCPVEPVEPETMAFWVYTSGTTGIPKAAVHLHRDLLACHRYGVGVLKVTPDDRLFATSKLFFAYALGNALLVPLFVGARVFFHPDWPDPEIVDDILRRFQPTVFLSVPTFYLRLLEAGLPADRFSGVRFGVSAGERLPEEVYRAYRDRYGLEILDAMGATETVFMALANAPGRSRAGSSGTAVPGTEARLLDPEGNEVGDGEQGVLHVKMESASPFYWNREEQSRRTFAGDWFRTGDVYTRDADGFFYHCGREDDFFKVAGMWVTPADVEAVLRSHPDVADAAVVGAKEERGLVKCYAFVVPADPGGDEENLRAALTGYAEAKLPTHQRPRRIFVLRELPRTATGKLQRFRLAERLEELLL